MSNNGKIRNQNRNETNRNQWKPGVVANITNSTIPPPPPPYFLFQDILLCLSFFLSFFLPPPPPPPSPPPPLSLSLSFSLSLSHLFVWLFWDSTPSFLLLHSYTGGVRAGGRGGGGGWHVTTSLGASYTGIKACSAAKQCHLQARWYLCMKNVTYQDTPKSVNKGRRWTSEG